MLGAVGKLITIYNRPSTNCDTTINCSSSVRFIQLGIYLRAPKWQMTPTHHNTHFYIPIWCGRIFASGQNFKIYLHEPARNPYCGLLVGSDRIIFCPYTKNQTLFTSLFNMFPEQGETIGGSILIGYKNNLSS